MKRELASVVALAGLAASFASAQSPVAKFEGPHDGARFGFSLAKAGDVDGDGVVDLVIGAPSFAPGYLGNVTVRSGSDFSVLHDWMGVPPSPDDWFGYSVAGAGDLDGDGRDDVLVGAVAPSFIPYTDHGYATILSGLDGSILQLVPPPFVPPLGSFGEFVSSAGDVDGDGMPDFMVSSTVGHGGMVSVFSGPTGATIHVLSSASFAYYGRATARLGDADGDGRDDLLIGDTGLTVDGGLHVVSGATGLDLMTLVGPAGGGTFGASLAGAGDLDLDGIPDAAVGGSSAAVFAISGATGATIWSATAGNEPGAFGASVASVADANNDGVPDLLVGSPNDDPLSAGPHFYLVSGADGSQVLAGAYPAGKTQFGSTIAGFGTCDGLPLAAVGAPWEATGSGTFVGTVSAFSLVPKGISLYGPQAPGCAGPQPFGGSSVPFAGNANFRLTLGKAPQATLGLALVADAAAPLGVDPFGVGIPIDLDLFAASEVLAFDLPANSRGFAAAAAPIPNNPALAGKTYFAQGFSDWNGSCPLPSPFSLSATRGLAITIQP